MDDSPAQPMVEAPTAEESTPEDAGTAEGRIPGPARSRTDSPAAAPERNGSANPFAGEVNPYSAPAAQPVPAPWLRGPVPGSYAWAPVPGPRNPWPAYPPVAPSQLWPHAVTDPRRDRQTPAIVVCSLLAALVTVIAAVTALPDRGTTARAASDAGKPPQATAPENPDDSDDSAADDRPRGPGSTPNPAPSLSGPQASADAKTAVLDRAVALAGTRGTALRTNDAAAFTATVDKNDKALVDAETRVFANLRKVDFQQSDWVVRKVTDARGSTWPVTATVDVAFRHQIRNADVRPVAERYVWTVRCAAAASCTITGVHGAPDSRITGPAGYPAPWDLWDLAVEQRPHVVVMGSAEIAADLRRRADEAEAAAVYDFAQWRGRSGDTSPGFVITLTDDRADFDRMYSSESAGDWAAGFALPMVADGDNDSVGGSRVVIDLDEMKRESSFATIILRHELVHAMLDPITRADYDRIPLWTAEGFADWLAQADRPIAGMYDARAVGDLIADGKFRGTLPTDADFASDDEDVIDNAYSLSHLAVRYLADTYGADKACAFIADIYQGTSRTMDAAIRAATGISLADFEKGWAAWIRATFG